MLPPVPCSHSVAPATVETAASETHPTVITERELQLQEFIHNVHRISRSGAYPTTLVLKLLDQAWAAQKLLWQLRSYQATIAVAQNDP